MLEKYIKTRIKNYEVALDKIQQAIEECGKNSLWDIVSNLEKGKFALIDLIEEDRKLINK